MSTLSTANIESKAANTPPVIKDVNGTECGTFCRAWVNFNGRGTVSIRDNFNVSSITDHGAGDYSVNFSNNMPDANYCVSGTAADLASGSGYRWLAIGSGSYGAFAKTTSAMRVQCVYDASNKLDADHVLVVIHGN